MLLQINLSWSLLKSFSLFRRVSEVIVLVLFIQVWIRILMVYGRFHHATERRKWLVVFIRGTARFKHSWNICRNLCLFKSENRKVDISLINIKYGVGVYAISSEILFRFFRKEVELCKHMSNLCHLMSDEENVPEKIIEPLRYCEGWC